RRQSQVKLILNCQTDRGKARTQGQESNKIWQQRANGNRLKAATKRRRRWVKWRKDHSHNIATSRRARHGMEIILSVSLTNYPLQNARPASLLRRSANTVSPAIEV